MRGDDESPQLFLAAARGSLSRAVATVVVGAVATGALLIQWPDLKTFHVAPVVLVCLGSVALAVAAAMLLTEPGQVPNAAMFGAASVLFTLEWAFTWPATPFAFLALPLGQLFAVVLGVVLLRYPHTRMQRGGERCFVWFTAGITVVGRTLVEITSRPEWFASGLAAGRGRLPPSTWWITLHASRGLSHAIAVTTDLAQLLTLPVFLGLILRRLRRETRPLRAELWPVVVSVAVLGGVLLTHLIALLATAYRPASAPDEWISATLSIAVMLVPLAFIVASMRVRLARGQVADLVEDLTGSMTGHEIEDALRRTVGDDSLRLIFWLTDDEQFVDVDGHVVADERSTARITVPATTQTGDLLAVVSADPALRHRPQVLRAAVSATSLVLENARLEAELRARLAEAQASRARIAAAELDERRRIERDLHDGVQQQLIALGATLGRLDLREDLAPSASDLIDQARQQLRRTRRDLRDLARGVHPAVLDESGLAAALASVTQTLPMRVQVSIPNHRWSRDTELTAYFVACEALANCAKHARARDVVLAAGDDTGRFILRVSDNGRGGAIVTPGGGLAGLRDRARALGGELSVVTTPGAGTTIEVRLPCA